LTNLNEQTYGMIATFHGHALISDQQWNDWQSACMNGKMSSDACVNISNNLQTLNQDLFPYGVDYPKCPTDPVRMNSNKPENERGEKYFFYKHLLRNNSIPNGGVWPAEG